MDYLHSLCVSGARTRFLLAGFGGQLQEIPSQKLVRRRRSSKGGKMDVVEGKVSAAERGRVAISGNGCGLVWLGWNPRRLTKRGLGLWRGSAGRGLPVPSTAVLGADVSWSSSLSRVLCLLGVSRRRLAGPLARDPRGRKCRECRKCTGGRDLRNVQCSNGRESRWKGFQPRIDRQGVSRASPSDDPWRLQDWPTASLLRRDGLHWSTPLATKRFMSTMARHEPAIRSFVSPCRLNSLVAIPYLRRRFVQSQLIL